MITQPQQSPARRTIEKYRNSIGANIRRAIGIEDTDEIDTASTKYADRQEKHATRQQEVASIISLCEDIGLLVSLNEPEKYTERLITQAIGDGKLPYTRVSDIIIPEISKYGHEGPVYINDLLHNISKHLLLPGLLGQIESLAEQFSDTAAVYTTKEFGTNTEYLDEVCQKLYPEALNLLTDPAYRAAPLELWDIIGLGERHHADFDKYYELSTLSNDEISQLNQKSWQGLLTNPEPIYIDIQGHPFIVKEITTQQDLETLGNQLRNCYTPNYSLESASYHLKKALNGETRIFSIYDANDQTAPIASQKIFIGSNLLRTTKKVPDQDFEISTGKRAVSVSDDSVYATTIRVIEAFEQQLLSGKIAVTPPKPVEGETLPDKPLLGQWTYSITEQPDIWQKVLEDCFCSPHLSPLVDPKIQPEMAANNEWIHDERHGDIRVCSRSEDQRSWLKARPDLTLTAATKLWEHFRSISGEDQKDLTFNNCMADLLGESWPQLYQR